MYIYKALVIPCPCEYSSEPEKRIKNIKIKMKDDTTSNDTMSVDELNQAAKTLKLDPLPSLTGLKG